MVYDDYFFLGTIQRTYHTSGSVIASFDVDDVTPYLKLNWIFLEENNSLVPHEVKRIKQHAQSFIIDFADVNTHENASALVKKNIYLPLDKLPKLKGNQFYFHEVVGFTVHDKDTGELGKIEELQEYPGQTLAKLRYNGKEVLLPLLSSWITKVDRENKQIIYSLPQGYLDVYTSEE